MADFNAPRPTNPILGDVNQIHDLLSVLAQMNPALADNPPEGAKRIYEYTENGSPQFRLEKFVKGSWVSLGAMNVNVSSLQGYVPSTSAKAGTIPVYNSAGQLVGNITGNAPTATKLAIPFKIDIGGIAASTAQNVDGTSNVTIPLNSITINNAADTAINGVLTPKHGGSGRTDGASLDVVVPSLSGDVLAKSYGQIGMAKAITYDTNADSLIVEGIYMLNANVSANWAKNKWPSNHAWNAFLRVYYNGSRIHQIFTGLYGGSWMRSSGDKGASWSGWLPVGFQNTYSIIYISKSGNDLNMGLDPSYPVLTFGRAMQIAYGLVQNGSSGPSIIFRFGEGNWGNITIRNCPFVVQIQPYDGGVATSYSTSLPVFGIINVELSYIWYLSSVAQMLNAAHSGAIYVMEGYKRIGSLRALNNGTILVGNQNSPTNMIDFTGGSDIPMRAAYGGIIYAAFVHLRLCGNLTVAFLDIQMFGRITVVNGQTTYDPTAFTNTAKKYNISNGGMFNSSQPNGNLSWLNALPGAQAGSIDDSCYINGRAMANVLKAGDTMTGPLSIKVNGAELLLYDTGLSRAAAPAANLYRRQLRMFDAQSAEMGAIQAGFTTAQRMHVGIFAQRVISGQTKYAEIGGAIDNDGSVVGYAPTPATGSNTNDIATTAWVRSHVSSIVGSGSSGGGATGGTVVDNKTLSGVTIASGTINKENVKLSGTPSFLGNDDRIPNLYWVNNLCGHQFYGMCPNPSLDMSSYSYNSWYPAPCNGYVLCSFAGSGKLQAWEIGVTTTPTASQNAGTMASALTIPVQYKTYFKITDQGNNGNKVGFMPAIAQHSFNGTRPTARTNSITYTPGFGRIFLKIVGGEYIEAFGDLTSLANYLGLEFPDPDRVEIDTSSLSAVYQDGLVALQSEYEDGLETIEKEINEKLKLALFEAEQVITALYKDRDAQEFELTYKEELQFATMEIERVYGARKGQQIVALQESMKIKYEQFQESYAKDQYAYEIEYARKVEEAERIRDAVCEKAGEMADMIIDVQLWDANYCAAHLEDGKIVLGRAREDNISLLDHYAQKKLEIYDRAVMKLEREKRLADAALKGSRMGDTEIMSRYSGKEEEIKFRLMQWDIYASKIVNMPNEKGYPWDGGGKATPWPDPPVFES